MRYYGDITILQSSSRTVFKASDAINSKADMMSIPKVQAPDAMFQESDMQKLHLHSRS